MAEDISDTLAAQRIETLEIKVAHHEQAIDELDAQLQHLNTLLMQLERENNLLKARLQQILENDGEQHSQQSLHLDDKPPHY